ncbi:MAG: heparinase II/III family protein [Micrococcales bacterium]|nr:heparinase II/III family protein [Micrococcales bacterium]
MQTLPLALALATVAGLLLPTASLAAPAVVGTPGPAGTTHVLPVPPEPDVEPFVPVVPIEPLSPARRGAAKPPAPNTLPGAMPGTTSRSHTCTPSAADPVVDGARIAVTLPPAKAFTLGTLGQAFWGSPIHRDPTWQLNLYSFRWIAPLVRRAVEDNQNVAKDALLGEIVTFYRVNPDSGRGVRGWDEGSSLRRLETLNCLYAMTQDARLVKPMEREVAVQFGPRYYGPPRYEVHNHGLMANLRVVEAGQLLNRRTWMTSARARIRAEAGMAFTARGTSWEQSAAYQGINRDLWAAAANTLQALDPNDPVVATIRATVARAANVAQWVTEPDGGVVQIGDSKISGGSPAPQRTDRGVFRDDQAGLVVGRWSWKDPATTYYSLRYGPPRRAHGHPDQGQVTWSAAGSRILVGSGFHSYDPSSPYAKYSRTPTSANVAIPAGRPLRAASMRLHSSKVRSGLHAWVVTDSVFGRSHSRGVTVNHAQRTLTVRDAFRGSGAADQVWHLDPQWKLVSTSKNGRVLRFKRADRRTLEITTTAKLASALRGSTRPVAGWNFPAPGQRVPNWELRIRWSKGTATTTFKVR